MTITGTVNEDSQIVTDDGKVYDVVDSEMGGEVVEMVDKKVKVTGTVEEDEPLFLPEQPAGRLFVSS